MLQRLFNRGPTFRELSSQWLDAATFSEKHRLHNWRLLNRHVWPVIGDRRVYTISDRDVAALLERLAETPGMQLHVKSAIACTFTWARKAQRFAGTNPAKAEWLPTPQIKPRERCLNEDEIAIVWKHLGAMGSFGRVCRLILCTGARPGEIGSLWWPQVKLDYPGGPVLDLPKTKNGRQRFVVLTPLAVAHLPERRPRFENLFGDIRGQREYKGWGYGKRRWAELGIGFDWTPHSLRKTAATAMGDLGVSDDVVSRILGHAPRSVTRQHYNFSQKLGQQREALDLWSAELSRIVG